jgi:hypothetical protein
MLGGGKGGPNAYSIRGAVTPNIEEGVNAVAKVHGRSDRAARANAKLIAAAPDLLEALQGVIGFIDDLALLEGGLSTNGPAQQRLDSARAAIAKAAG